MKIIPKELLPQQYESVGIKVPSVPQDMRKLYKETYPCGTLVFPYTYDQKNKKGETILSVPNVALIRYYIRDGKPFWRPRNLGKFYVYDLLMVAIEKGPEVAEAILEVCKGQGITHERLMSAAAKKKEDDEEEQDTAHFRGKTLTAEIENGKSVAWSDWGHHHLSVGRPMVMGGRR